jgi:hypothetical protein
MKKATTYRIKAEYGYYAGTLHAPQDGYLMDEPEYDIWPGRETCSPMTFETIADAYEYLTGGGYDWHPSEGLACEYDGKGSFSVGGTYVTRHGQHSRPHYSIVSAKSGRTNKAIVAACDEIAAKI